MGILFHHLVHQLIVIRTSIRSLERVPHDPVRARRHSRSGPGDLAGEEGLKAI